MRIWHHNLFILAFALCASPALALPSVNIMADSSLSIAITEIARDYSRDHGVAVNTSYSASKLQQEQITAGEPADILITPIERWIEELKTQGVVDVHSQMPVARGKLALVGPVDSPLTFKLSQGFPVAQLIWQIGVEPGFVIGNPETLPEGSYAREAMRNLGASSDMEPYTLYIKQLGQMFEMINTHKAYGIFLYSSVLGRPDVRILDTFPEDSHRPIQYHAVVIAGENMDEARRFLDYLKTADARRTLAEKGFITD